MFQPNPAINPIAFALFKTLPLAIMIVLVFNMLQRALWKGWGEKRAATFYFAIILGFIFVSAMLIGRFHLPDLVLIPAGLGSIILIIVKRKTFFPFRLRCPECHTPLSIRHIISGDTNLCTKCVDIKTGHME